ncbi:MAG TPA: TonB-dependent receptor, partial [Rhizomicrobium sp.]|nr:TonB-dependent receptor [Rhizomicrobium sp.]
SAGPLNLIRFGANGAQSILNQGQFVTGVYSVNGNGDSPMTKNAVLGPRAERDNLFARASYDFGDDLDGYVEAAYSRSRGQTFNSPNYNAPTAPLLTIGVNNAFLPANIKAAMVANGFSQIVMARLNQEMGNDDNITSFFYYRAAAGLSGKLGTWSWDTSVSYSKVIQSSVVLNNRNEANWARARDSVIGPNGQPICTSTLTNPTDGCVPVNVFGIDAISPAATKYITGTGWRHVDSTGWDLQGNLTGTLFHNWAGPVSVAMGAEYRDEGVNSFVDPVSAVLGYRQTTQLPFSGALTVAEGYVESSIPLLVDVPFAQDVHLDLAGRAVSYSTSGWADVWKSGLWWGINDSIKIRANYSRDFRAPTLNELFAKGTQTSGVAVFDREHGNASLVILSLSGGNPFLKPEKSITKTLGVVLTPSFIPGLQLSLDYYNIAMKDAITGVSVQATEDRCFQGLTDYCKFITRDPVSGLISKVQTTSFNAQALKTDGFDFESQYSFGWDMFDADGSVTVSAVATYIDHLSTITNGVSVDTAGQIFGGTPHWRGTLSSTYRGGPWTIRGAMRFVGGGKYNNSFVQGVDINRNNYPAFAYIDTTVSYDITDKIQVYGKIENLMDTDPPIFAVNSIIVRADTTQATNGYHDLLGRMWNFGVRVQLD